MAGEWLRLSLSVCVCVSACATGLRGPADKLAMHFKPWTLPVLAEGVCFFLKKLLAGRIFVLLCCFFLV